MGRHCSRSERNIMKKSKRDLIFSILSVFLIAFLMFAEISSGMAIYADTFNNNGAMPNENNGGIDGDIDNDMSGIGNGSADNGNGNLNESGNTATDGSDNSGNDTSANTGDKNTDNMETWGWILAVVAIIVIIAIIIAATSKKKKTDEKKRGLPKGSHLFFIIREILLINRE